MSIRNRRTHSQQFSISISDTYTQIEEMVWKKVGECSEYQRNMTLLPRTFIEFLIIYKSLDTMRKDAMKTLKHIWNIGKSRVRKSIFFRLQHYHYPNWVVRGIFRLYSYERYKTTQTYSNQKNFWAVTKLESAAIIKANVIVLSDGSLVIPEEFPPLSSVETDVVLFENEYYFWKTTEQNATILETGSYAASRKQELFYHAVNWVLTRVIELGFFEKSTTEPKLLLIDYNLHWRVKEFLRECNSQLANNWDILELGEKSNLLVRNLEIVSTRQEGLPFNSFLQFEHARTLRNIIEDTHPGPELHPRIYLIRDKDSRSQDFRSFMNQSEIEELLTQNGFSFVDLARCSLIEQIKIMSKAKIIVGTHGGNFTLLPFAVENEPVLIEIFCGLISDCFEVQSENLGIGYKKVYAKRLHQGFEVDVSEFSEVLFNSLE